MRVLLTGGNGMLGRAIRRRLPQFPQLHVIAPPRSAADLRDPDAVDQLFRNEAVDCVIHAAARVGGIQANVENQAAFLTDNMQMNLNVINGAFKAGIDRLLFIGSSCMYPKDYVNPLKEEYLLAGALEPTNEGYALAKIAGAKLCDYLSQIAGIAYRTVVPCNLYGPGDSFAESRSHLVAAVIAKTLKAVEDGSAEIEIWGDGTARREFLYVDDLASFLLTLPERLDRVPNLLNIGANADHTVDDYYRIVADIVGFKGRFRHDLNRPVGMTQKLLDSSRAAVHGWQPSTTLEQGIATTVRSCQEGRRVAFAAR